MNSYQGRTQIKKVVISDPEYGSSVRYRLAKILPSAHKWDMDVCIEKVNVGDAQHPNYVTAVGLYILRENKNVKIDLIGDRTHESFTQSSYVAVRHGTIGTDTKKNC